MAKSSKTAAEKAPVDPPPAPLSALDRIRLACAKAREVAKSTEGQVPAVIASATPKVAKVVTLVPAKGNDNRVYGLNMGLEFDPAVPVYASFEVGPGKDGKTSVLQSRRREGASPEYTVALWTGKPGKAVKDGGNCLAVCVPMGALRPHAQAFAALVDSDADLKSALEAEGRLYTPAHEPGTEGRTYLALSLQEVGIPLFCFGETQADGTVKMVANHAMGPWSLGEFPSVVVYQNRDGSESRPQYLRGRPFGTSKRNPESFAFKVLSGVIAQAMAIEGTAKAVADFRGATAPFGMSRTRTRGRQGFRTQVAAQSAAPEAVRTPEGAAEDDLSFERQS